MKKLLLITFLSLLIVSCNEKKNVITIKPRYTFGNVEKVTLFNAAKAYSFVEKQISFGPRNPNSKGHKQCLDYLKNTLAEYADEIRIDSFHYNGYDEKLQLFNIIGKYKPELKNRILLGAHWDTRPRAERSERNKDKAILGANDGASGVAVLLETARHLNKINPSYGIDIVFFDAEDYGTQNDLNNFCIGSKYFAAINKTKYLFAIILDMVGDKNAKFIREYNSYNNSQQIVDAFWKTAEIIKADKFIQSLPQHDVYDDHIPLIQAGINAIDIIDAELIGGTQPGRDYWHSHKDDLSNINKETLKQVGDVLLSFLKSIKINEVK